MKLHVIRVKKPCSRSHSSGVIRRTELKPCPFCGGKGVAILEDENKYLYYRYMAQCQKCGANAKLGRTKEEARKAWNRRAEHE